MDIKENSFYRRIDITEALGIYPQWKDFASNNDEYVTMKGGMGASAYVLSGSSPPTPPFGGGELSNGFLRCLVTSADLSNAAKIPKLELYKIKSGIPLHEGSMEMATGTPARTKPSAGEDLYIAGAYMDGENIWKEENFDGTDKSLGEIIPIRSIGTSTVTLEDAYMDVSDARKEIFIGGGNFPAGGSKTENLKRYFADPSNNQRIPVKPESMKNWKRRWIPRYDKRTKKQKWQIYMPFWKWKDIKGHLNFAKTQQVSTTIETTVEASKNNTIFNEVSMTPNQNNPFTFNTTTKPLIYSTVELTSAKKSTGGQSLRVYHNWSHISDVADRKRIEGLFSSGIETYAGAGGGDYPDLDYVPAAPQIARLGISGLPKPAALDMGHAAPATQLLNTGQTGFDYQASMPEINFRMNISKLAPNIPTTIALTKGAKYWTSNRYEQDVTYGALPYIKYYGQSGTTVGSGPTAGIHTPVYGFFGNLSGNNSGWDVSEQFIGQPNTDGGGIRNFTYQRGIVMILSTRKPEEDENSLDKFLSGLYHDDVTFGGLQFMSYANPLASGGSTTMAMDSSIPSGASQTDMDLNVAGRMPIAPGGGPWNTGSEGIGTTSPLVNVDTPSIWIKPVPIVPNVDSSEIGPDPDYSTPCSSAAILGSSSIANCGGIGVVSFKSQSTNRLKAIYSEEPGYWFDGRIAQASGTDGADNDDARWTWNTKNWARVLKDSWFDMKLVFNPFVSCSAQQYDVVRGNAGTGDTSRTDVAVRAYFNTEYDIKTGQTASSSAEFNTLPGDKFNFTSEKFVPYVNIPMFNRAVASRPIDYNEGGTGATGFTLMDDAHWPTHITWWFMNYRWVASADTPSGDEPSATEKLWLAGDNILQPDGGDMELEAYFDSITFKHWNNELDNASVGRGDFTSMVKMQDYGVETPKRALTGTHKIFAPPSGGGFLNSGCFTKASTGYHLLIGLKEKTDLPYTDGSIDPATLGASGGFFLFNNFTTHGFKNLSQMQPSNTFMSTTGYGDTLDVTAMNRYGNQLGPSFKDFDSGDADAGSNINWSNASYSGSSLNVNRTQTALGYFPVNASSSLKDTGSSFYMASGVNDYLSLDGFSQKGLTGLLIVHGDATKNRPVGGTVHWTKREHILASARITAVPSSADKEADKQNLPITPNYISVDKPEIFNVGDPDEEYVIYKYFALGTGPQLSGAADSAVARGYSTTLKLAEENPRDGDTFTFDTDNIMTADDGSSIMFQTDGKAYLGDWWISPKRYWLHMAYGTGYADTTVRELYQKPLAIPRVYESVNMLNISAATQLGINHLGTPKLTNPGELLGTTYNEFKYTYVVGEETDKGKSGVYQRAWSVMESEGEDTDLVLTKDYGFGTYNQEKGEGGQLGIKAAIVNTSTEPSRYTEFPLSGMVKANKPAPSEAILFKMGLSDEIDTSEIVIYGDDYSGVADYRPHLIWEYHDELPKISEFMVEAAADILEEDTNLYELTTEPLNTVKFTWKEEGADDLWYRMLFIGTGSINNKYHNAQLHIPFNEGPTTIGSGATNKWYKYTGVGIANGNMTNTGSDYKADIEGLAGYCISLNPADDDVGYPYVTRAANTSVSGTDYTVALHAIPNDLERDDSAFLFAYGTGSTDGMDISLETTGKIRVRHAGTVINGTSIFQADGETPLSVIVIYRSGSSDGKDLKLYVNGALEDYYAGILPNIEADSATAIGAQFLTDVTPGSGSNMFSGKIEEVVVYNHAAWVPDAGGEFLVNTEDLPYNVDASTTYQAKLFAFDYHNIRGRSDKDVCSSNQIAWKVTTV